MARLTISLPESLKVQLEQRAAQRKLSVSQVAHEALEASLSQWRHEAESHPSPATPRLELNRGDAETRRYLTGLLVELERLRSSVDELAVINGPLGHPPPSSLPRPPWPA